MIRSIAASCVRGEIVKRRLFLPSLTPNSGGRGYYLLLPRCKLYKNAFAPPHTHTPRTVPGALVIPASLTRRRLGAIRGGDGSKTITRDRTAAVFPWGRNGPITVLYSERAGRTSATNVRYHRGSIDGPLSGSNPTPEVTTKRTAATYDQRARRARAFGLIDDRIQRRHGICASWEAHGFLDFLHIHIGIFFSIPKNWLINNNEFSMSFLSFLYLSVSQPEGHESTT